MAKYLEPYSNKLKYNKDEVIFMMETAFEEYVINATQASYWMVLQKHGLPRSYLRNWIDSGEIREINILIEDFRTVQQERLVENGLNGEFNSGFSRFLLESHYGEMKEVEKQKLNQQQQVIDTSLPINIGFTDFELTEEDDETYMATPVGLIESEEDDTE